MPRFLAGILTGAAVLWVSALLFVPLRTESLPTLKAIVYGAGALVCHQRPERSFHVHASQLPVCARCTGLYLAGALGALAGWLGVATPRRGSRAFLFAAAIPTLITLAVEWSRLGAPGNVVRAMAALPLGGVTGWLFVRMLRCEASPSTCATIS
jgi:uncharacterized membrane protein